MKKLYVLTETYIICNEATTEVIGVFESQERANAEMQICIKRDQEEAKECSCWKDEDYSSFVVHEAELT